MPQSYTPEFKKTKASQLNIEFPKLLSPSGVLNLAKNADSMPMQIRVK